MKHLFFISTISLLLCLSCNSKDFDEMDKESTSVNDRQQSSILFPINPCDYITRKMIITRFEVAIDDLEFKKENEQEDLNSNYSKCGYIWKKSNYEDLQKQFSEKILKYISKQQIDKGENAIFKYSEIPQLESPNNLVQIGHFQDYESVSQAKLNFENAHHAPTEEEFKDWYQSFNKQIEKGEISEHTKQVAEAMPMDIVDKMKFSMIEGVGDQAYYDHLSQSLDVRFGNISFSVFVDTELDFDTNLELAKELANEVWEKL